MGVFRVAHHCPGTIYFTESQPGMEFRIADAGERIKAIRFVTKYGRKATFTKALPGPLVVEIDLEASDIEDATKAAAIHHQIALIHVVLASQPTELEFGRLRHVYDITPGLRERQFHRYFYLYDDMTVFRNGLPLGAIDHALLSEVIDESRLALISASSAKPPKERIGRIIAAQSQYLEGLQRLQIADKFLRFWDGLEYLAPLLEEQFHKGTAARKCRTCSKQRGGRPSVRHQLIETFGDDGAKAYDNAVRARNAFVHWGMAAAGAEAIAREVTPFLSDALLKSIYMMLGLASRWKPDRRDLFDEWRTWQFRVGAVLSGEDPEALGIDGQRPDCDLDWRVTDVNVGDDGIFEIHMRMKVVPFFAKPLREVNLGVPRCGDRIRFAIEEFGVTES